ncbi:MAG: PDC sensor domain-containing protein, partial [Phocaeicola sp.]
MAFKLRSFSTRLSLYIVSAVLLFFIASFLLYFNLASKAIKNEVFQKSRNHLLLVTKGVDAILEGVELSVKSTVHYVNASIDKPEEFESILRNMIESNPSIYGASVAFERNFYEKYGTYYMLYGHRSDSVENKINFTRLGSKQYDYLIHDWYQIPKLLKKDYWSEPYFDEGGGGVLMTTYTHLLYDKDSVFIGTLTADMELGWLSAMVLENKPYEDSYAFMLSRNAYYLVHPISERILNETFFTANYLSDPEVRKIGLDMIAGVPGSRIYERDGELSYAFYKPISRIGWSVGTVTSERVIMAQFNVMARATVTIAICGVLFIFIFTVLIIRTLSKPLELFSYSASEIANGNFDTELPDIKAKDEMLELRNAFINMQVSLKKYITELKSTTAERERIESELAIAHSIQMGMLPKVFPPFPNHEKIDLYAKLAP